jgi:hypothetical protein
LARFFNDAAGGSAEPIIWMAAFITARAACLLGAIMMAPVTPPIQQQDAAHWSAATRSEQGI